MLAVDLVIVTTGAGFSADTLFEAVFSAATDGGNPLPSNPPGLAALDALTGRAERRS